MAGDTVGLIGVGDMGSSIGGALVRAGVRVVTALGERSAHSRRLAEAAGIEDVGSLGAVAERAGLVLSIVPPAAAAAVAEAALEAFEAAGRAPVFADCNAVAPATAADIARRCGAAGIAFADAGLVGRPPRPGQRLRTRLYVSGPARGPVLALPDAEIEPIDLGPEVGRASAAKMAYASLNKATNALYTAVVLAAERLGVRGELMRELDKSQPAAAERVRNQVPFLAADAERYAGEMREIAATFASVGVTTQFHDGARWLYELLAASPLAAETRADQPQTRSLDEALAAFATALDEKP